MIAAVLAGMVLAGAMYFPARNRDRRLTLDAGCVVGDQL
jgi:hypothetical protein